ncbi:hypothetical protein SAMN05216480_11515 [Pustulibacterium marinum]|uniref:Chloroplast import component protein (Tic20) n=1 Tax=Pustulibacterium marinum TaxID=1224947 RepID=A0A1I7ID09_9FLAO|nr:hypothetical protein [Pustulibacterium marinum]SFU70824.1 hypothetical protein SAMN05216480_11515 [Pustulibacterium marinum]
MENEKTLGIVAYCTFVGTILAYYFNKDKMQSEYVNFHVRQMLGLIIMQISSNVIDTYFNNYVSLGLLILTSVCWVICLIGAIQYKKQVLPFLGSYFQKWFYTIGN